MRRESASLWEQAQEDLDTALYDQASARLHLELSRQVMEWVRRELGLETQSI